jgi:hypothetical protein
MKGPDVTTASQPPPGPGTPPPPAITLISHQAMDQALGTGQAVPLGTTIRWFARYHRTWWLSTSPGWIRCDDPQLNADLDARHATLTACDALIARDASIKTALAAQPGSTRPPEPGPPGPAQR